MKNITIQKLKNGFMVMPEDFRSRAIEFERCFFVEGFDVQKVAEIVQKLLVEEVEL